MLMWSFVEEKIVRKALGDVRESSRGWGDHQGRGDSEEAEEFIPDFAHTWERYS